ncbi:hypothetical protein [Leptospira kirschneri]|uniref:hypothetical protein n=1 Tax=Leptospira kirschneri TaxID=29507 RepID=UPI0002BE6ACD|nr:hypothetical protein [Leptospira kirschneri]EMO80415.1 hypothetical protein LEP1GSC126_2948 [Leptospira kirschneri str. 200801774]KON79284.1 Uncharacterized protein NV38_0000102 [Leptospira kirschneri serovar Mozdok]KPZ77109.1 hypothetical protein APS47_12740 [Leptospira kirschneri serovar Mozdok]
MKINSFKEAAQTKAELKKFHRNNIQKAVDEFGFAGLSRKLKDAGVEKCSDAKIISVLDRDSFTAIERLSLEVKKALFPNAP